VTTVLVDTNVFVSFLTDRNRNQQEKASVLLERGTRDELTILVHGSVLTELAFVLTNLYARPAVEVASVLEKLLTLPGAEVSNEVRWERVLDIWPSDVPGFGDALVVAAARVTRADAVATFDAGLARRLPRLGLREYWRSGLDRER
jgi:predicted nucleic acid-binding protein